MKFVISLVWAFIFSFVALFFIVSILGNSGQTYTVQNCALLAAFISIAVALFDLIAIDKKRCEK